MSFWCHHLDQHSNKNIVKISALKSFVASWGLPRDLVSNINNKEAYRKPQKMPRKPQGRYKNFQGRNPYNIFFAVFENRFPHKFIMSLTDLQGRQFFWFFDQGLKKEEKVVKTSICIFYLSTILTSELVLIRTNQHDDDEAAAC